MYPLQQFTRSTQQALQNPIIVDEPGSGTPKGPRKSPERLTLHLIFLAQLWIKGRKFRMAGFGDETITSQVLGLFGPWNVKEVPAQVETLLILGERNNQ